MKQTKITELDGHSASIKCIAKCPERGLVATGGRDGMIILYDLREKEAAIGSLLGEYTFT